MLDYVQHETVYTSVEGIWVTERITAVDILYILGELNDEGENSSRQRFVNSYLRKIEHFEGILADIDGVLDKFEKATTEGKAMLNKVFRDLVNRLAELAGLSVKYSPYENEECITGEWGTGKEHPVKVAALIPQVGFDLDRISKDALVVLSEKIEIQRPFVTLRKLSEFLNMVKQVNIPLTTVCATLAVHNSVDRKLEPIMELILLAFKKEIRQNVSPVRPVSEWAKEELSEFVDTRLKLPTKLFLVMLTEGPREGETLLQAINCELEKREHEPIKSPMALGAIMGALSKHYGGVKEELVLRKGKKYSLNEKYIDVIKQIREGMTV